MKSEQKRRAIQMINAINTRGSTVSLDAVADLLQEMIWEPDQSEQHLEMVRDAERLNWILPSVSGEDSQTANTRTFLLAHQLLTGKTGKTAIDAAIAAEKVGTQ